MRITPYPVRVPREGGGGHAVADAELTSTPAIPQDGKGERAVTFFFQLPKKRASPTVEGNGGGTGMLTYGGASTLVTENLDHTKLRRFHGNAVYGCVSRNRLYQVYHFFACFSTSS